MISISNFFKVTTDFLVGKSNQKNFEDEFLVHKIQSKSKDTTTNIKRQSDIENYSLLMHNLLVELADIELTGKNIDDVWEMISLWLNGLSFYRGFISLYNPPTVYPLDEAKNSMDVLSKLRYKAMDRVGDMLREIIDSDIVDKDTKSRVIMKSTFGIKPNKNDDHNDEKAD